MKKLLFTMFVMSCSLMLHAAKANKSVTIKVGNQTREYWLYVPNNVKENAPLVLSLHGAGGHSTDKSPFRTDVADKEGCIVAYPQGLNTVFPGLGGMSAPGWSSYGEENFDTDFLKAVVEDVASKYTIDRQRLYCCGFSNGGMMTYVMANTCSHMFAAFAAISGYPINEFHLHYTSWRPVPLLHIHGKADDFVKYSLVPNVIEDMVARNGANPVPKTTIVSGKYTKNIYEAGEGGFPVIFYEIDGMGHSDFTNNTEDNNSAQTMWNFFKEYTLDSPCDTTMKWRPRIETEGYEPKKHGWIVSSGLTVLRFGGTQNNNSNQNVYRSLQFKTGSYKLHFKAEGDADKELNVTIQKLTDNKNKVLDTKVAANGEADLCFTVDDGWGEYRLSITRPSSADAVTITDLGVFTSNGDETGIRNMDNSSQGKMAKQGDKVYDLQGCRISNPRHGIYVKNGKKIIVK